MHIVTVLQLVGGTSRASQPPRRGPRRGVFGPPERRVSPKEYATKPHTSVGILLPRPRFDKTYGLQPSKPDLKSSPIDKATGAALLRQKHAPQPVLAADRCDQRARQARPCPRHREQSHWQARPPRNAIAPQPVQRRPRGSPGAPSAPDTAADPRAKAKDVRAAPRLSLWLRPARLLRRAARICVGAAPGLRPTSTQSCGTTDADRQCGTCTTPETVGRPPAREPRKECEALFLDPG